MHFCVKHTRAFYLTWIWALYKYLYCYYYYETYDDSHWSPGESTGTYRLLEVAETCDIVQGEANPGLVEPDLAHDIVEELHDGHPTVRICLQSQTYRYPQFSYLAKHIVSH